MTDYKKTIFQSLICVFLGIFLGYNLSDHFPYSIRIVSGPSMVPSYYDGNYVYVSRISLLTRGIKKNDIVEIKIEGERLIKRIVGLPEETVIIENKEYHLDKDYYFVMGDNINNSEDSRDFGPIHKSKIIGIIIK